MRISSFDLGLVILALGAVQAFYLLRFFLRLRLEFSAPPADHAPAVSVLVPCKEAPEGFEDGIEAMLGQDYPGPCEFLFVLTDERDPAFAPLSRLLERRPGRGRIVEARAAPVRSSAKLANLIEALKGVSPRSEALVFADSDQTVPPGWLRSLVAPLGDPAVGVATSPMLYVPARESLWPLLRMVWMGWGIVYCAVLGRVFGHAFAMRRRDFETLGVASGWSRSFSQDMPVGRIVRRSPMRVEFVGRAISTSRAECSREAFFGVFNRWVADFRTFDTRFWLMGLAVTAVKVAVLLRAALEPAWGLAVFLLAADMATLYGVFWVFRRFVPDRFLGVALPWRSYPLIAAWSAPLMLALYAVTFANSLWMRTFYWGGYTYRLRSADEVAVLGSGDLRPRLGRAWAGRLLASAVGGCAFSFAFGPFDIGWFSWLGLVPFFWATQDQEPDAAFGWGWVFGCAAWSTGLLWFRSTVVRLLNMSPAAGSACFGLLCAYHGLMFAAAAWAVRRLSQALERRLSLSREAALLACATPVMVAVEGFFPQYFPAAMANAQFWHPAVLQSLDLFGTAGICWLAISFNVCVYLLLRPGRTAWRAFGVCAALVLANEAYGLMRIRQVDAAVEAARGSGRRLRVALIQGAVPRDERNVPECFERNLGVYNALTARALESAPVDLVVWPQDAYERVLEFDASDARRRSPSIAGVPFPEAFRRDFPHRVPALLGVKAAVRGPGSRTRRYAATCSVSASGDFLSFSAKRHLTPFSEFTPFGRQFPALNRFRPKNFSGLSRGRENILVAEGGTRVGAYICYEELLSGPARRYSRSGAELLAAITRDDQFAEGDGMELHFRASLLRAIENRRFLLRSSTSGVSAVADPVGRVSRRLERSERGFLVEDAFPLDLRTLHSRIGDLFHWLGAVIAALLALACRGRGE
ncbi:MAG: apolipoprotein N-acyltransferase [Elusimicrobiota bacterium]